jgi:CRISPR-associated protein Cmr4
MATTFYLLRALSNLHAGAGDADFGIIDKHVQRDALTGLPTIHASSIKGSMRQLFETNAPQGFSVTSVFGSASTGDGVATAQQLQQGNYIFYPAKLLALPIRSNHQLFFMATTAPLLRELLDDVANMGVELPHQEALESLINLNPSPTLGHPKYLGADVGDIQLEDMTASCAGGAMGNLAAMFGDRIALLHVDDFARLAEELPTVARNSLDNGISVNLWYEEIVPRETRFYCPITALQGDSALEDALNNINGLVQIGGNATVGMGLSQWQPIQ